MSVKSSKQFQGLCVERYSHQLKKDLTNPTAFKSLKAIFQQDAIWKKGSKGTITVTFGTNSCSGCSSDASWSMIGSECTNSNPSTNLGFIDVPFSSFVYNKKTYPYADFKDATRNWCSDQKTDCDPNYVPGATILHEFGHAMGMLHEHQNNLFNSNTIKLNKTKVIEYYNSIGLGEEGAYTNMLEIYDCSKNKGLCNYDGSKFDPDSIMLYHLPDDFVIGPNPTKGNFKYSALDKEWLNKKYPLSVSASEQPFLTVKFIDKNEKPWKQAWVTKNVTEFLCPLVGVRFRFAWADGTSIDYRPTEVPVPTIAIKKTETPVTKPSCPACPTCSTCPAPAHMLEAEKPTVFSKDVENPVPIALSKDTGLSMSPATPTDAPVSPSPDTSVSTPVKEAFTVSFYNYVPLYILCVLLFLVSIGLIRGYSGTK